MIDLDILVILDRSGSMQDLKSDHEGGLKSFVEEQKTLAGDVRFTLVQFDSVNPCEIVYDRVPIADVGAIHLVPRGGTPLLDAMGKSLAHLESRQILNPSARTVVLVVTDGEENESKEWSKNQVAARVAELEKKDNTFLYLGANVDAFHEAGQIGVGAAGAMAYAAQPASVASAYASTSENLMRARSMSADELSVKGFASAMAFTDQQRAEAHGGTGS